MSWRTYRATAKYLRSSRQHFSAIHRMRQPLARSESGDDSRFIGAGACRSTPSNACFAALARIVLATTGFLRHLGSGSLGAAARPNSSAHMGSGCMLEDAVLPQSVPISGGLCPHYRPQDVHLKPAINPFFPRSPGAAIAFSFAAGVSRLRSAVLLAHNAKMTTDSVVCVQGIRFARARSGKATTHPTWGNCHSI